MEKFRIVPTGVDRWKVQKFCDNVEHTREVKMRGLFGGRTEYETYIAPGWSDCYVSYDLAAVSGAKFAAVYIETECTYLIGLALRKFISHDDLDFVKECLEFYIKEQKEKQERERIAEERAKTIKPIEYEV